MGLAWMGQQVRAGWSGGGHTGVECESADGALMAAEDVEQLARAHAPQEYLERVLAASADDLTAGVHRDTGELDWLLCHEGSEVSIPAVAVAAERGISIQGRRLG